jgi:hypothetical protein
MVADTGTTTAGGIIATATEMFGVTASNPLSGAFLDGSVRDSAV